MLTSAHEKYRAFIENHICAVLLCFVSNIPFQSVQSYATHPTLSVGLDKSKAGMLRTREHRNYIVDTCEA